MRKSIIAIAMMAAAFAANIENANAQTSEQVNNNEAALVDRLVEKAEVHLQSEVPIKFDTPTSLASQKNSYFDCSKVVITTPAEEVEEVESYVENLDSLVINWRDKMLRNASSEWMGGVEMGYVQLAENGSPIVELGVTYAGKRLLAGVTAGVAASKYNKESSKAGKSFVCPIFSARVGLILSRFSLGGYDNMGYWSLSYVFKYIQDKNKNLLSETVETEGNIETTTSSYYKAEGNSMGHCLELECRFSLKHMRGTSLGFKVYGGMFNRYYLEGSRTKALVGVSANLNFNFASKHVDNDVKKLRQSLENGEYELANKVINKIRAERMK